MDARPTCHRRRVVGCGGGGSKTAAKKRSWLRLCVSFMYVFHLCIKTGWRVGFCERALLGAPVGRTRADTQRADTQRSTTTHGRSRRGGAGGTRRARAEQTEGRDFSTGLLEGTFQTCCNLFKSKGLRISSSNASILIHNDGRWLAGAAAAARARWRRRRSARRLPRGAGRASRGAPAGHGDDSW